MTDLKNKHYSDVRANTWKQRECSILRNATKMSPT